MTDRPPTRLLGAFLCCALGAGACEENLPEIEINQFDRPQDVALVCYDVVDVDGVATLDTMPLACCAEVGEGAQGYCDGPVPGASVLAFVTQTTPGEVAVVSLDNQSVIDQDTQIPYNSFVPVGGQPSDIAAAWNGRKVYTANYETGDLSVVQVSEAIGPMLEPSAAIDVGGPAARIAIARAPSIRDRFAFVTQPTMGRLAVAALDPADCPDPAATPHGCLLGHMRLDSSTGKQHAAPDDSPEGVMPWAIAVSDVTPSIYVSGMIGTYIIEIDTEVLAQRALALDEPGDLGEDAVVRRIDTVTESRDYTTSALALEPSLERWIYAVENETGGVIVVKLFEDPDPGDPFEDDPVGVLPVNRDDPLASNDYSIDVPGRARAIAMVRYDEDDDPSPLTFDGTFAVVSTTKASVFVIDADDRNADPQYPHTLRSAVDYYSEDSDEIPHLEDEPALEADGTQLSGSSADSYAGFVEPDGGAPGCDEEGVEFDPEGDWGVRLRCNPRLSTNEEWTLTWEGKVGISGAGVVDQETVDGGTAVLVDEGKSFCPAGLRARDQGGTYAGFEGLEGYAGDVLRITSEPTPWDGADCSSYEGEDLSYQVIQVVDEHSIRISEMAGGGAALPSLDCFGEVFTYEVRAHEHWVLKGGSSGYLKHSVTDLQGQCTPLDPDEPERARWRRHRVFEGVEFENYYLSFLLEGSGAAGKEDVEDLAFTFSTEGGYEPLYAVVGNDITDIEISPGLDLVLVDRAGEGMVVFDLAGGFSIVGSPVN